MLIVISYPATPVVLPDLVNVQLHQMHSFGSPQHIIQHVTTSFDPLHFD